MISQLDNLERALLGEIVEHPKDELALHVYADWLLDHDDRASQTRGEHLKIQLQLARACRPEEVKELHWLEHDLWWNHGESWVGGLYEAVDHFLYERGRLVLEISEATFLAADAEVIRAEPAWERVTDIVFRDCSLDLLLFLGTLPRPLFLLDLHVPARTLVRGELDRLLADGFWDGLQGLYLRENVLGDEGALALACWHGLDSLRRLNLVNTLIGPEGAEALWRAPGLEQIEKLSIQENRIDPRRTHNEGSLPSNRLRERFGKRVKLS